MSPSDLPEELSAVVRKLYPTELMRSADEGGGVQLSFITDNRLYRLEVRTEETPLEFTLSSGTENLFMEAPPGGMAAFVAAMRKRFPSANYGPRGPHGADFSAAAHGKKLFGLPLEAEFLRCKQVVDLCLDGQSQVAFEL
jgi:hypothetical protein